MANTEGMSDDDVARLLSTSTKEQTMARRPPTVVPVASKTKSSANKIPKSSSAFLRDRMRMDMSDRPAATVIRPSRDRIDTNSTPFLPHDEEDDEDDPSADNAQAQESSKEEVQLPPLVGSIVERHATAMKFGDSKSTTTTTTRIGLSKFAQSRTGGNVSTTIQHQPPSSGFPSVHVPFGTFVTRRDNKPSINRARFSQSASTSKTTTTKPATTKTPMTNTANPNDIQGLIDVSRRDAESMLQGLSPSEIQEQVQELESSLSPQTIAFLRKRRQAQTNTPRFAEQTTTLPLSVSSSSSSPNATLVPTPTTATHLMTTKRTEREEKERIAHLLASIRTYEDLDKAYAAEMRIGSEDENTPGGCPEKDEEDDADNDFNKACDLLRSTAPRQRLWAARVVAEHLRSYEGYSFYNYPSSPKDWPFPILLPVSLRCLLDERPSISNGNSYHALLYTYVLQSLYALLRLGAHPLHVVDVTGKSMNDSTVFQHYFLDDAIPTIPFGSAYPTMSVEPVSDDNENHLTDDTQVPNENTAMAYATASSSTSSQSDGEAFRKDPMWTLLSKMRIIPRVAQILEYQLPSEAIVALCGILAMLGVRSPGAGTAIMQHPQIMARLTEHAMSEFSEQYGKDDSSDSKNERLLPFPILLCTLARQSHVIAQAIDEQFFAILAPPILATPALTSAESLLQRWTLCLWRTLLRYGYGLAGLSTMITLSSSHLAVGRPSEYSVAVEFFTAFANVFDCVGAVCGTTNIPPLISAEAYESLVMAGSWLSSTFRQTIDQLSQPFIEQSDEQQLAIQWRLDIARLRFVSSFLSCHKREFAGDVNQDFKAQDLTEQEKHACIKAAQNLLGASQAVELALNMIAPFAFSADWNTYQPADRDVAFEACAFAFVESFASFVMVLAASDKNSSESVCHSLASRFVDTAIASFQNHVCCRPQGNQTSSGRFSKPRKRWINQTCFAISKVFAFVDNVGSTRVHFVVRAMVLALLGRLEMGDEALAAVLLSQDLLFGSTPRQPPSHRSVIAALLLRELSQSEHATRQLEHSFELLRGLGSLSQGPRLLASESLMSEVHMVNSGNGETLLLPLGPLWLWQLLSGSLHYELGDDSSGAIQEASAVVEACLELIVDLEKSESSAVYAANLDHGAKLYMLFNLCLLPEVILRRDFVSNLALTLFASYSKPVSYSLGHSFAQACHFHSSVSKKSFDRTETQRDNQESNKLLDMVRGSSETRALEDFVGDLCDVFSGYGAQYELCTRCVRFFILPCFPLKIRCEVLQRLRELDHMLTLPSELNDRTSLDSLLEMTIVGGIPNSDRSDRDPPALLDILVASLKLASTERRKSGYIFLLSIALVVRGLAWSLQSGMQGIEAAKARISDLPNDIAEAVTEATFIMMSGASTKERLIDVVVTTCHSSNLPAPERNGTTNSHVEALIKRLQQTKPT